MDAEDGSLIPQPRRETIFSLYTRSESKTVAMAPVYRVKHVLGSIRRSQDPGFLYVRQSAGAALSQECTSGTIQRWHAFVSIRTEAIRLQKSLIANSQETGYGVLQIVAAKGIPPPSSRFAISRTSVVLGVDTGGG